MAFVPDDILEPVAFKDQLFDLRGLSAYSSLGVGTLRDYLKCGLPHFKVKGKILVRRAEFDKWLEGFRVDRKQELDGIVDGVLESFRKQKTDKQFEGR